MNLATTLLCYGTPEGVEKAWDTRGRGRKETVKHEGITWRKPDDEKNKGKFVAVSTDRLLWTQNRLHQSRVEGIKSYIKKGSAELPALTVSRVKGGVEGKKGYWVHDGHHRLAALEDLGKKAVVYDTGHVGPSEEEGI